MEYASLIAEIRIRMGNPSSSVLDDNMIRYAIDSALGELSRFQPLYTYGQIDLVKDVPTYTLDSNIVDVRNFWYTPKAIKPIHKEWMSLTGSEGVPAGEGYYDYEGIKVFHSPSLRSIFDEKWDRMRSRQLMDWEFNSDTKELLVIPAPSESGKAVYKGTMQRTIESISPKYESAFKDLVRAFSMETWVFKTSTIKSIPVGVGKVDYDTDNIRRIADSLKREALGKLISGGSGVAIG